MLKKQQKPKKLSGNGRSRYHLAASRDASLHSLLSPTTDKGFLHDDALFFRKEETKILSGSTLRVG